MATFLYPGENITGIIPFLKYVNSLTAIDAVGNTGLLGVGMLIIIGFVSFLATKAFSFERALGFSAFLTLISAIFLRFLSLISDAILFLVIVLFIGSVILLMRERNVEEFGV